MPFEAKATVTAAIVQTGLAATWPVPTGFPNFSYSPYFFHIPFISFQGTLDGKRSVFIGF